MQHDVTGMDPGETRKYVQKFDTPWVNSWWYGPDSKKVYERWDLHRRFLKGPNYRIAERDWGAHLCGETGRIVPYAYHFCNRCCSRYPGLDVVMSEEDIEAWNHERSINFRQEYANAHS